MKKIYRLTPALFSNVWGGNKLRAYGKNSSEDRIGESWELSFVSGSEALSDGVKTSELFPKELWGKRAQGFDFFPTLTKFIDARDKLSVQVHPSDDYALKNEGQYGKSEMWYVVDADEGAGLYMGFNKEYTPCEVEAAIEDGSIENMLSFKSVKPGDVFFIPAGTVHAIGGGVLIYEIQQNSTLTYRLYDYKRRDQSGKLRELHVEKAMKVLDTGVYLPAENGKILPDGSRLIGTCEYFTVKEYELKLSSVNISVSTDSFKCLTVISGEGEVSCCGESYAAKAGDSFFAPAAECDITVFGSLKLITVEV